MWPSKGGEGLSPLFQSDNFTLKGFEPEVKLRNPAYFVIFGTISDLFWPYFGPILEGPISRRSTIVEGHPVGSVK